MDIEVPSKWPNANARLLGMGAGLPIEPIKRLAQFDAAEFERFTLEWAMGYLAIKLTSVSQVQQRGGAGDKGRDVVVWLDPPEVAPRRWSLYQCKHYANRLGWGAAAAEIGKILFYTLRGDYRPPVEYSFVTHKGVTSNFQDQLDDPEQLRADILADWDKYCRTDIRSEVVDLSDELRAHIEAFDFSIFRAKQPLELIEEHAQTRYHLTVFGAPLIERVKPSPPPSAVAPAETRYTGCLLAAISDVLGQPISSEKDLVAHGKYLSLFKRSRITFYCAENLKELARDQMANIEFFDTLLEEFRDGLYHQYTDPASTGLARLRSTVSAAQFLQLTGHVLDGHVLANDREGMCHHLANDGSLEWIDP